MGKISNFFENWTKALKLFAIPHTILGGLTCYGMYLVNNHTTGERKVMFALVLGLLISFLGPLLTLHCEGNPQKIRGYDVGIQIFALFASGIYYLLLKNMSEPSTYAQDLIYFGILPLGVLGILFLLAMIFKKQETKIWFSWSSLLQALSLGILAGLIVWGGLSGALQAINALFDLDIYWKWYQYFGVFSMIFLAGSFMINHYTFVVTDLSKGDKSDFSLVSTRLMKIFGSYIFLPLALIYLLILGTYGIKVLITGIRPKGIIVWLGSGYFAWGMLTYYFTFHEQIKFFSIIRKVLFMSFILIALMMAGALGLRISQYGLSINRYFVTLFITLIIGFSAGAICFPKIRLRLFITLFAGLAVLSLYGPLSARNIAFWSQKSRIVHLLSQRNITLPLEKNALSGIGGALANDLSETITDFVATFPYEKWNMALFGGKYSKKELTSSWAYGYDVRGYLGIQKGYGEREEKESKDTQFGWFADDIFNKMGMDIEGYHTFYDLRWLSSETKENTLYYTLSGEEKIFDLTPYLEEIYAHANKNSKMKEGMGIPFSIETPDFKLIFTSLRGIKSEEGKIKLEDSLYGYLLVK